MDYSFLESNRVVPVVVLKKNEDTVPTLSALKRGGIFAAEITFRTACAAEAIALAVGEFPDMLIGAGTVTDADQCERAYAAGAKFIVSPGYDEEVVSWCCENNIPVCPGCATPTEIMMALKHNLKVIKFFPANVYGGLSAIKALAGPFVGVKFIPTGGVNLQNVGEFISDPHIHAVGGSWVCPKADIAAGNFEKITQLCKDSRKALLGFEVAHVGINCADESVCDDVCKDFADAFDFPVKKGNSSNFASTGVEVMKTMFRGANGHIAIRTNKMEPAIAEMERRGFELDMSSVKDPNNIKAVYFKNEVGGFAVHLVQK